MCGSCSQLDSALHHGCHFCLLQFCAMAPIGEAANNGGVQNQSANRNRTSSPAPLKATQVARFPVSGSDVEHHNAQHDHTYLRSSILDKAACAYPWNVEGLPQDRRHGGLLHRGMRSSNVLG